MNDLNQLDPSFSKDCIRINNLYSQFRKDNEVIRREFLAINESASLDADNFFKKYGAGLFEDDPENIPYGYRNHLGRARAYLDLLGIIKKWNHKKFEKVHKGTPYCFLGWLFIDICNFDQAVFYMDAAMSEDQRNKPNEWLETPATRFMFLKANKFDVPPQKRIIKNLRRNYFLNDLRKFNKIMTTSKKVTIAQIIEKFVKYKINIDTHRTLISSLYIYILEGHSLKETLKLKGSGKGSIEPFLTSLHRGCLILESLLKEIYPSLGSRTLGNILLRNEFVKQDIKLRLENFNGTDATLEDLIKNIIPFLRKKNPDIQNQWFSVSYSLRNVTSHNLLWPDMFDSSSFELLYEYILFSILYLVKIKYVQN